MPIVLAMDDVTVVESLGLSVLGIIMVFLVLVFLMAIVMIMTHVMKKSAKIAAAKTSKPADSKAQGASSMPDAQETVASANANSESLSNVADTQSEPPDSATVQALENAYISEEETTSADDDLLAPDSADPVPGKYRVIINGVEYEVDAEMGEALQEPASLQEPPVFGNSAGSGNASSAPVASAAVSAAQVTAVSFSDEQGVRKYRVIVNGVEYEVDEETGETYVKSGTGKE